MRTWEVFVSESARKDFYEIDKKMQTKIKDSFSKLKENPFQSRSGADIKKLKGNANPAFYRLRVGDYRLIYTIGENDVKITRILLRKHAYDWLD